MKLVVVIVSLLLMSCSHSTLSDSNEKAVYILGSYHNLKSIPGSEELFEKTLKRINPDLVFIEWPTTWFDENGVIKKNYPVPTFKRGEVFVDQLFAGVYDNEDYKGYDSAILGQFVRENKLKLVPFDIADRNKITHFQMNSRKAVGEFFKKLPKMKNKVAKVGSQWIESISRVLKQCYEAGLPSVNSLACDAGAKEYYNLQRTLYETLKLQKIDSRGLKMSVDWWARRRKAMAENVCKSANKLNFKRGLIHMGWHHRYHIIEDIKKCKNFKLVYLWEELP